MMWYILIASIWGANTNAVMLFGTDQFKKVPRFQSTWEESRRAGGWPMVTC